MHFFNVQASLILMRKLTFVFVIIVLLNNEQNRCKEGAGPLVRGEWESHESLYATLTANS